MGKAKKLGKDRGQLAGNTQGPWAEMAADLCQV